MLMEGKSKNKLRSRREPWEEQGRTAAAQHSLRKSLVAGVQTAGTPPGPNTPSSTALAPWVTHRESLGGLQGERRKRVS